MTSEGNYNQLTNTRYRYFYIIAGFLGLVFLGIEIIANYPEVNPETILLISIPDMVLFFLAYKTYPLDDEDNS